MLSWVDRRLDGMSRARVWSAVLGLLGLIPVYIAGNFFSEYMAARVGASVSNDLRLAAFWRVQALSVSYHRGRPRGDLLSRFSSDLDAVERAVVSELPFSLSCLLSIAVGVVLLFTIEWRLALALCALLPMVIVGPRWLGARAGQASYERQREAAAAMSTMEESIAAHSVIKAFDLQGPMLAEFGEAAGAALSEHRSRQFIERPAGDVDQRERIHSADPGHIWRSDPGRAGRVVRRRSGGSDRPAVVHRRQSARIVQGATADAAGRRGNAADSGSSRGTRAGRRHGGRTAAATLLPRHPVPERGLWPWRRDASTC